MSKTVKGNRSLKEGSAIQPPMKRTQMRLNSRYDVCPLTSLLGGQFIHGALTLLMKLIGSSLLDREKG